MNPNSESCGPSAGLWRWLPPGLYSERNVKVSLCMCVLGSIVSTVAHGHLFTAFTFELFGDNTSVGLLESAAGVTALVTAVPVGLAVDRVARTRLLRLCAVVGLLAAVSGAAAVLVGPHVVAQSSGASTRLFTELMLGSMVLWGVFFNTTTSASLALFTDSVPRGSRRHELFAVKSTVTMIALSVGPLLVLALTAVQGNDWDLTHMSYALLPGFLLMPVMCWGLLCFEEVGAQPSDELAVGLLAESGGEASPPTDGKQRSKRGAAIVPYLILAFELLTSIGAGMTVKFFSLWFKNDYKFSPIGLAMLQAASPLAIAVAVQVLHRVARACPAGPVPAILGFWLTSIVLLLLMVWVKDWRVLVCLHLLRTALANCKEPLARAILADFIPSAKRGRWNAVHSLTGMTWAGSAALGSMLCDRHGYGNTFVFTAGIYLLASCFWLPIIPFVPRELASDHTKKA